MFFFKVDSKKIKRLEKKKDIRKLIYILSEPHKYLSVKKDVADALGEIGDKQAVRALIQFLKENEHNHWIGEAKRAAENALVKLGDKAVELLIPGLHDFNSSSRILSYRILREIGDKAINPLIQRLNAKTDALLRREIARLLGDIGDMRAIQHLVNALKDEDRDVRYEAASALRRLGWQPTDDNQRALYAIAHHEVSEWANLGRDYVELLVEELNNVRYGRAAAEALGRIGDERAVRPLVKRLKQEDGSQIEDEQDTEFVDTILRALESIIMNSAENMKPEYLYLVANLNDITLKVFIITGRASFDTGFGPDGITESVYGYTKPVKISCESIRNLARNELIRRGKAV